MLKGGRLRRWIRIPLLLVFCLLMYLAGIAVRVFGWCFPGKYFRVLCRATSFWGYGMAKLFGMNITSEGPRPEAPFYLVSNHISYMDILLVCAVCPAWFISKSEVARWPGIGPLTRIGPTIYINREIRRDVQRMNRLIANLVVEGGAVGFFPEGTTSDGEELLPFKPSLFQPAVEMNLPVTTAVISYSTGPDLPPPSEVVAWYGDADFVPHLKRLLELPAFSARIKFGEEPLRGQDRKELAQRTHRKMKSDLRVLKKRTPAC